MRIINSKKYIPLVLIFLIFSLIYIQLFITCITKDVYTPIKSDVILVLGYSLEDDQTPSLFLEQRLETALDLYNNGYSDHIIVSGGIGPTDSIAVAESMKSWLIDNNVPRDVIITENTANNTYENFTFSKEICDANNFDSVIIVTSDFHMYRSMLMAKEFFPNFSGKSAIHDFSFKKLIMYLKEPLSIIKYEVLNKNTSNKILNSKN